jgi:hypothetical protein
LGDGRPGRFPYLLRGVAVERANQAWCTDLTYEASVSSHFLK